MTESGARKQVLPAEVLGFWLAAGRERWFEKDDGFDAEVRVRFQPVYEDAAAGRLGGWEESPDGTLALIIVLDQFPRNMFRGSPRAYAADSLARAVATRALEQGFDQKVAMPARAFFYLPFEHSENPSDQERSLVLMRATDDAEQVQWAELHADIIRRFGRFPHRNAALGRVTTAEEHSFPEGGGFKG